MSKCCFLVSYLTAKDIYPLLEESIYKHITEYGVSEFFINDYSSSFCFHDEYRPFYERIKDILNKVKLVYKNIKLIYFNPYYLSCEFPVNFLHQNSARTIPKVIEECNYLILFDPINNPDQLEYMNHLYISMAREREKNGLLHIENLADKVRSC